MNIAVNTRNLISGRNLEGIGRFTFETLTRICVNHPEHHFYFFFDRPYTDHFIFSDNVTPIVVRPAARHPVLFYLWFEIRLPKYFEKYGIDVFLSPDGFLSLQSKVPQVAVIHDLTFVHHPQLIPFFPRKYYQYYFPKFIHKASHLIAVSQFVKNDIIGQFGINSSKIDVVYNALPTSFNLIKEDLKKSDFDFPYFILPGSIHPRKNTNRILRAFQAYHDNNKGGGMKIVVVGKFMWKPDADLKEVWDHLATQKLLIHIPNADDAEMVQLIQKSRALLYISLFEGFGIPILEGWSCGVPVITSNVSSMPEIAGDAAMLVNPREESSIITAMTKIIEDEALRELLINKGKTRLSNFNWDVSAELLMKSLLKVVYK